MSHLPSNAVALIVGGTSGIGLATAKAFTRSAAHVVVAGRNSERGLLAEELLGATSAFLTCDVRDPSSVASLVQAVVDRFGRLDCAVNCAASDWLPSLTHEIKCDAAAQLIACDVLGVFHCMKYQIEAMLKHGAGTIVNVSSVNGLSGTPSGAMYSAGRHAVLGLSRSTAKEYISRGIRINVVCPGPTDTPRRERRALHLAPDQLSAQQAEECQSIPIGRLARPDEIASAILWLSSPQSSYVVGHALVVDGGLSA